MQRSIIRAKSDASYKEYNGLNYIGIGLAIRQRKGINFTDYQKYLIDEKRNSSYAELRGIIEILKRLQKIRKESILVISDSQSVINNINKNKISDQLEDEYKKLYSLIDNIKHNGNVIEFQWQPREKNTECDQLSKKKEFFEMEYELLNGENGIHRFEAINEIDAQRKHNEYINMRNKRISGEKINSGKQSRSELNKMLKMVKRNGIAYA